MKKLLLILLLIPNFLLAKEQCENMQQPPQEFMGTDGSCIYKVRYSERSSNKNSIKKFVDLASAIEDKMKD